MSIIPAIVATRNAQHGGSGGGSPDPDYGRGLAIALIIIFGGLVATLASVFFWGVPR